MMTFFIMCSLLSALSDTLSSKTTEREITVFIRVDDIFMRESKITPQEIDSFLEIAEKHNAHVILATIPARLMQLTNHNGKMAQQLRDYANRGHQISQHGYNHICPFTSTTNWEFYTPNIKGYTHEQMIAKITEGKHLLEAAIGRKVTNYVGPGSDNTYVVDRDDDSIREIGFVWLSDPKTSKPYFKDNKGYFFSLNDYCWALTEENYKKNMDEAKEDFKKAIEKEDFWGFLFHDHFTRKNYNNGITLKWFDEFLTWMESQKGIKIKYSTLDEYYKKLHPDFSIKF